MSLDSLQDDPMLLVKIIIGLNILVFLLWHMVDERFMRRHFMVSRKNVREGRVHTLLTSCFSQFSVGHLLGNMVTLYFFAPEIVVSQGPRRFLGLYLGSGIAASCFHLLWSARKSSRDIPALGASGSVNALTVLFACQSPFRPMYLMFIPIPIPAWLLTGVFLSRDLIGAGANTSDGIGHAAHLGGAACGLLYHLFFRR